MTGGREGESRDRKDRRPTSKGGGKGRKGGESPFRPLGKEREENSPQVKVRRIYIAGQQRPIATYKLL